MKKDKIGNNLTKKQVEGLIQNENIYRDPEIYRKLIFVSGLIRNICLFEFRCLCKERLLERKKERLPFCKEDRMTGEELIFTNRTSAGRGRFLKYHDPKIDKVVYKAITVYYEKELSEMAKLLLQSFKNKYVYYAIEDINCNSFNNLIEKQYLLSILYSSMSWLHNNQSINFFDIWIDNIHITEKRQENRFIETKKLPRINHTKITVILNYRIQLPKKNFIPLW